MALTNLGRHGRVLVSHCPIDETAPGTGDAEWTAFSDHLLGRAHRALDRPPGEGDHGLDRQPLGERPSPRPHRAHHNLRGPQYYR